MNKIIIVIVIGLIVACSSEKENPGNKTEIKEQISEYKKQVNELNKKISELEKQMQTEQSGNKNGTPISTLRMEPKEFNHFIDVNGTVEAISAAAVSPEINGHIQKIYINEGDRVRKGQLLIKISSNIIENSIKEVETALELAITIYQKQEQLWSKNIGSEMDYLSAKNSKESMESKLNTLKAQLDLASIKSPINGIVDEITVKEGELAVPGYQIIQLVNLNNLYVNADVSEAYLTKVKKGDIVLLEFPSYPDVQMKVPVHRTGNIVKSANRTFKVQLRIKNNGEEIKPNVLAKIKINDFTAKEALIVPSIIIKQDLNGSYIYITETNDNHEVAKKVYVKTGKSYGDKTMITEGLNSDDEVIVNGYNHVSDGSIVDIRG